VANIIQYRASGKLPLYKNPRIESISTSNIESYAICDGVYCNNSGYKAKVIWFLVGETIVFACPDSGAEKDIMSENFALENGLVVNKTDPQELKIGNGQSTRSVGSVFVQCGLLGGKQGGRRFHVLRRCIYPVIVGMKFLKATKLFTENKHMLVERPSWYLSQLPRLGYITSGQWCPINCDADGQHLIGCADTGSDLDLMSLDFSNEKGFIIDRRESVCRRVQLADGSIVETIGCVRVSSLKVRSIERVFEEQPSQTLDVEIALPSEPFQTNDESEPASHGFEMTFHVLPGLPHDAIFSQQFLDQMDAFNTCTSILDLEDSHLPGLYTLIDMGPKQKWISNILGKPSSSETKPKKQRSLNLDSQVYRMGLSERRENASSTPNLPSTSRTATAGSSEASSGVPGTKLPPEVSSWQPDQPAQSSVLSPEISSLIQTDIPVGPNMISISERHGKTSKSFYERIPKSAQKLMPRWRSRSQERFGSRML